MFVREIRKESGLTQQQMAQEMAIAIRTVATWEAKNKEIVGLTPLMQSQVERFAKKHGIDTRRG